MQNKRYLKCSCCGGDAGKWAQHWNRDTGYGICPRCVAAEAGRETPDRLTSLYGEAGVNYGRLVIELNGRQYTALATTRNPARANAFMEATPFASVLMLSAAGEIVLADSRDLGEPLKHAA